MRPLIVNSLMTAVKRHEIMPFGGLDHLYLQETSHVLSCMVAQLGNLVELPWEELEGSTSLELSSCSFLD